MTVSFTANYPIGSEGHHYEWVSDQVDPTYYEYVDGVLVSSGPQTWRDLWLAPGEMVQFEVLDSPSETPEPAYPSRAWLAWYADAVDPAYRYRVDEYVDSEWVQVGAVLPQLGQTYFTWLSRVLEDETTHQFRVVPVAFNGEDGLPLLITVPVVRRPDPPTWTGAYDSGTGNLTVTVA